MTREYSDYILSPDLTETAVQDAIPTESYGNFGLVAAASAVPATAVAAAEVLGDEHPVPDDKEQRDDADDDPSDGQPVAAFAGLVDRAPGPRPAPPSLAGMTEAPPSLAGMKERAGNGQRAAA
jgi:hypothetical protein